MTLRVVLTVVEIVLLAGVVVYFLRLLTGILSHIGDTLEKVSDGVKAIDGHCTIIGPGADQLNGLLTEAAGHLEGAAIATEKLGSR